MVLLNGGDFAIRKELMAQLSQIQEENRKSGSVTFAYGMSEYDPEKDVCTEDVFERADKRMYERKKRVKEGLFEEKDTAAVRDAKELEEEGKKALVDYPEDRKRHLDELFEVFSVVAEGTYVYLCDMRYDISRRSKNAVLTFGLPSEYMHAAGNLWEQRIHPEDMEVYHEEIEKILGDWNARFA